MSIIGISGRKQSGKDTVAKMLQYFSLPDVSYTRVNQISYEKWIELERHKSLQIFKDYSVDQCSEYNIIRYADKVKDIVCILLNCSRNDLENETFKSTPALFGYTPRELLQLVGTDFGRNMIHRNIWIKLTLDDYTENNDWIIPDVRFKNEIDEIKRRSGVIIRVIRPSLKFEDKHESETDLTDDGGYYDYVIENDSDIDELLEKVSEIYDEITDILA